MTLTLTRDTIMTWHMDNFLKLKKLKKKLKNNSELTRDMYC